jgi:glycosyltransferase involved in cell wall biosynthesis
VRVIGSWRLATNLRTGGGPAAPALRTVRAPSYPAAQALDARRFGAGMRILVHDYSGHPFQVQLSRELARRGHQVWHVASADFQTPKARLESDADLGDRLVIRNVSLGKVFPKDLFVQRRWQELEFGKRVGREILAVRPDVVLSSNAPLDTQRCIVEASRAVGARFVFWVQDLYGDAIDKILTRKFGLGGRYVGAYYKHLEHKLLQASDAVIIISDDFRSTLTNRNVDDRRIFTIENWAPLDEITYAPPVIRQPCDPLRLIYAGTLGYKHDPEIFLQIAAIPGLEVQVYSEGRLADELGRRGAGMPNLSVQGWAPFDRFPSTLASGDLLLAMIDEDAGSFSVPSKILTYLCAGRPIVASIPRVNLAARIIDTANAGLVSSPRDTSALLSNVRTLAANPAVRRRMGDCGRAYAMRTFSIGPIADRFERLLAEA